MLPPALLAERKPAGVIAKIGLHGCTVSKQELAQGVVANVPANDQIWLLVQVGGFYPQDGPLLLAADGSWASTVRFGAPGQFATYLVAAGPAAQQRFRDWLATGRRTGHYPGIDASDLPRDITSLSFIAGLNRT